jgi:single stranded DNA-binding protein (ssb)
MSLNKVMLIGNVGNDPEIRYLDSNPQSPQGNAKVASFRLATTERYRDRNGELRENTEWHNIVAWRNNADVAEKFVHRGTQLFIEGRLRTRQWTDQTGNKRLTTEIQVDNMQLLGKRPDAPQQSGPGAGSQPGNQGAGSQPGGYQGQSASHQGGYQGPGYGQPRPQPSGAPGGFPPQPAPQQADSRPAPSAQPAYPPQPASPAFPPADGGPAGDLPF